MSDDEFDFRNEIQEASWDMLGAHHERGALFILKPGHGLVTVGQMMAKDEVEKVKELLESGELYRPSEDQVSNWEKDPAHKIAKFLIVSPYVLIELHSSFH